MAGHLTILSSDPLIVTIDDFVSEDEARHLIAVGDRRMGRSMVVCDKPEGCVDPNRTSESAHLPPDVVTEPIRQRARDASGLQFAETIQIVRYSVGQEFKPHLDAFDVKKAAGRREVEQGGGQRAATFLVYLNEPAAGGATVFPKVGLSVLPKARMAVFWRHQRPGTDVLDDRTLHGGSPVQAGRKYAANLWLRQGPGAHRRLAGRHQINPQLSPASV